MNNTGIAELDLSTITLPRPTVAEVAAGRTFHVVSVHTRTGKGTVCTSSPMTREEADNNKGRFTTYSFRRMLVVDASAINCKKVLTYA